MSSPIAVIPHGLIAAPFTPMRENGSLNLEAVSPYAALLQRNHVVAAFVCGTTGEGASLTTDEREQVAARWRKDIPGGIRLIVHVGHNSLFDSQNLARHALKIGADAIATIAPGFFKPASIEDLVDWCADVAAAAPTLPFYYYHMPAMSGANFAMVDFLPRATKKISNFAGIKFTHENLFDYGLTVAAATENQSIFFGRDEILLSALALGATGAVGSTYNYMAPVFNRIISQFRAGQIGAAAREQLLAQRVIAVMIKHGGLSAGKAMMGLIGLDCGPLRRPLPSLTSGQIEALRVELETVGFFSAIKES